MSDRLRDSIAAAFAREEAEYAVPVDLRRQVVAGAIDRRQSAPGRFVLGAVLLAAAMIAVLIALRNLPAHTTPSVVPTPTATAPATPTATPAPTPSARFTGAHLQPSAPGPHAAVLVFTETGLQPGWTISYRVTGTANLRYDCGQGGPGGPSYPSAGPVDLSFTRTADAQGGVTATIPIPPPVPVPACAGGRQPVVTGDYTNFVVQDSTSGVSGNAGGINIAT